MTPRTFESFIAIRYLRAKRKQAVISVITVISIVGVAAGVAALVIGIAINNGFRETLQRSLLGATAHVMILNKQGEGIGNWQELDPKLRKLPYVTSVSPNLYGPVFLTGPLGSQAGGAEIKGIPTENPPEMLKHLKQGSFDRLKDTTGLPGIILGIRLAQDHGLLYNSVVYLFSPQLEMTPFGVQFPQPFRFRVVGIFDSGFYDIDSAWAFTSLSSAQRVFEEGNVVNSIELRLSDIYKAPEVAKQAEKIIGPKLDANTWMEQYHQILTALNTERIVTIVTISLIGIVAALNILITLIMMVMEKNRDIAVLMSMGAKSRQIRRIFMLQGVLIGAVGTAIGLTLGYTLSILADHYRWLRLNEDVYSLSYVPFSPHWQDGIWIAAAAIFVSLIATLYPAKAATSIAPVEALRYE